MNFVSDCLAKEYRHSSLLREGLITGLEKEENVIDSSYGLKLSEHFSGSVSETVYVHYKKIITLPNLSESEKELHSNSS